MKELLILRDSGEENEKVHQIIEDGVQAVGKDMDGLTFFESLPLLNIQDLPEEPESSWLRDAPSVRDIRIDDLESDRSFLDSSLLNVQYVLVNLIKSAMFEDKVGVNFSDPVSAKLKETVKSSVLLESPPKPSIYANGIDPVSSKYRPSTSPSEEFKPIVRDHNTAFMENRSPYHIRPVNTDRYIATPPKNIDTRTYTRPKKLRTSLEPGLNISSGTMTVSRGPSARNSSSFNFNGSGNLNETFVHDDKSPNEDLDATHNVDTSRRVSRNLSYVVRRSSDSPSENPGSVINSSDELNATFCRNPEENITSPTDSNCSLHNISMEELHNMARLQEQSLSNSAVRRPIVERNVRVPTDFRYMPRAQTRPPVRTSSTDTYYVGESNPESPGSSGLSSPTESQSYNDISPGGLGRSMPNLAITKSKKPGGMSIAPPPLQSKTYHISDSKLSHPIMNSKLSLLKTHASGPIPKVLSAQEYPHKEMHVQRNRFTAARPNVNNFAKSVDVGGGGDSRGAMIKQPHGVGLPLPRLSSAPQIRPPTVRNSNGASMLPAPGFSSRLQSRIPAPGALRTRPSIPRPSNPSGGQAGRPMGWRDGCY